jgi:PAS domain S-box-containing protein
MDNTTLEKALSVAGFAVLLLDEADRILDISPQAARHFGFEPDDLIGKPVSDFLPLGQVMAQALDQLPVKPPGVMAEVTTRDKEDRELAFAVNAVRWTEPDGRILTTLFIRDAALEKQVARGKHNRLVQSDHAIRGARIGVFEFDPVSDAVSVSEIWRHMLEIGPDEKLDVQQEWRSRVHPDDLEKALEPIRLCRDGHVERASCEYRLHSRDRACWRWMRTDIAVAQRDPAGRPSLLVGAQTDITERKETEDALRVSVERFRSAFYNASIGKAIVGLDGTLRLVNLALCDMLGYSETDLSNMTFQALTHPDDLHDDLHHLQLLTDGKIPSYNLEKRYYRADGAIVWGKLSVGLVRNSEGKPDHFIAEVVDITEQRRLDELKNQFVSVVSHELRTPLTSVLGALALLEFENDQFSDEVQRLLFIAKTNGDRLHSLINDILDFQKFTAKEMHFALAGHPVAHLVEETLLANLALTDMHAVRFSPPTGHRALVGLVDPKRFHQVMANLLSNAAKFAEPGSVVATTVEPDGPSIRISVTNVGPGIPDSFRERVFMPFSQAGSLSDRRSGGTGLGLSITKQIVEQMGGEIGFESTPKGQTTFWFTVRQAE